MQTLGTLKMKYYALWTAWIYRVVMHSNGQKQLAFTRASLILANNFTA